MPRIRQHTTKLWQRLKLPLTSLLIATSLSACGHLQRHDVQGCADLGPDGAHCAHTLTPQTRDIPKAEWDTERIGWLCSPADDFTEVQTELDQACVWISCSYEEKEALKAVQTRLGSLIVKAQAAKKKWAKLRPAK